jgi:hypothetical protein
MTRFPPVAVRDASGAAASDALASETTILSPARDGGARRRRPAL